MYLYVLHVWQVPREVREDARTSGTGVVGQTTMRVLETEHESSARALNQPRKF